MSNRHADRTCAGPSGGPNILSKLVLTSPQDSSLTAREKLFRSVLTSNPEYLPGIATGLVEFDTWYRRKNPEWIRVANTPAGEPDLVAHGAVRLNGSLPDRRLLEEAGGPRLSWELGMVVVRPGFRGCGIGARLIEEARHAFRGQLWASVHENSAGHKMLEALAWEESIDFHWPADPVRGLIMVSPKF